MGRTVRAVGRSLRRALVWYSGPGQASAPKFLEDVQAALDATAVGRRISPTLRAEVDAGYGSLRVFNRLRYMIALYALLITSVETSVAHRLLGKVLMPMNSWLQSYIVAAIGLPFVYCGVWALDAIAVKLTRGKWGSFRTLRPILRALVACPSDSEEHVPLPRLLRTTERAIRLARRRRATVPRFSHRHRALKNHANAVIAALRAAESGLDTNPDLARADLAAKLHTIAEQYADARIGALLPESELTGIEPQRNWEAAARSPGRHLPEPDVGNACRRHNRAAQIAVLSSGMLLAGVLLFGRDGLDTFKEVLSILRGGS